MQNISHWSSVPHRLTKTRRKQEMRREQERVLPRQRFKAPRMNRRYCNNTCFQNYIRVFVEAREGFFCTSCALPLCSTILALRTTRRSMTQPQDLFCQACSSLTISLKWVTRAPLVVTLPRVKRLQSRLSWKQFSAGLHCQDRSIISRWKRRQSFRPA